MPYVIKEWREVGEGVEMAVFEAQGQCVSMSPRPIARVFIRGGVDIQVEACSQHKARSMAIEIKELYS